MGARALAGAGWMLAWRVVTRGLGLVSQLVLARILTPADFGLVAAATAFSFAIDSLSAIGVAEALIRRPEHDGGLYDTAFTLQAIRGVVTAAIIALAAPAAAAWFGEPRLTAILWVLAASSVLTAFENIGIVEYRRDIRFDIDFRLLFAPRVVAVCVTIASALATGSYWAMIAGMVAMRALRLVMTYRVHPLRPRPTLARWRELTGFSFWSWVTGIANMVWDRCDPFIVGPAFGEAALGVYQLGLEIATLPISELIAPVTGVLFAALAAVNRGGRGATDAALTAIATLLIGVVPLSIAVSACSGHVVQTLLGARWEATRPVIAIGAFVCLSSPFSYVCGSTLMATNRLRSNFVASLLAAIVKAGAIWVAARSGDLVTVSTVLVGTVAAEAFFFTTLLRPRLTPDIRGALGSMARVAIAGIAMAGALWASGLAWRPVDAPALLAFAEGAALGGAGLIVFAGVLAGGWFVAGRPHGPEARVAEMLTAAARTRARRAAPS